MAYPIKKEETETEITYYVYGGNFIITFFIVCFGVVTTFVLGQKTLSGILLLVMVAMSLYISIVYIPIWLLVTKANWNKKKIIQQRLSWSSAKVTVEK